MVDISILKIVDKVSSCACAMLKIKFEYSVNLSNYTFYNSFLYLGPSEGFEPGVSPSKRLCDVSPLNCSPNGPVESEHINFDEENNIHEDPGSSSASDTSTSSSSATPMLFGEIPRQPLPLYRSKFTPPRSPLAGPSTTQSLPRTLGNSPSCFTFSPVQD